MVAGAPVGRRHVKRLLRPKASLRPFGWSAAWGAGFGQPDRVIGASPYPELSVIVFTDTLNAARRNAGW